MFVLIAIALALGLAAGFAFGGRIGNLREIQLRGTPILFVAVVVALLPLLVTITHWLRQTMQITSMLGVLVFLAMNIRSNRGGVRAGLAMILTGWLLNFIPIVSNGGMPLSDWAFMRSGQPGLPTPGENGFFKIVRARPGMWFKPLGDVVPVRPLGQVVSIGDIVMMIGIAFVIAAAMRARASSSSSERAAAAPV
jgi:hypothetical protein